jgi:hypothetical protein
MQWLDNLLGIDDNKDKKKKKSTKKSKAKKEKSNNKSKSNIKANENSEKAFKMNIEKSFTAMKAVLLKVPKISKDLVEIFLADLKEKGVIYFKENKIKKEFQLYINKLENDDINRAIKMSMKQKKESKSQKKSSVNHMEWLMSLMLTYGSDILADVTKKENYRTFNNEIIMNRFKDSIDKMLMQKSNFKSKSSTIFENQMKQAIENSLKKNTDMENLLRKSNIPIGVMNTGNSCYSNSILQVLFNYPDFVRAICNFREPSDKVEMENNEEELEKSEKEQKEESQTKEEEIDQKIDQEKEEKEEKEEDNNENEEIEIKSDEEAAELDEKSKQGIELIKCLQRSLVLVLKSKKKYINPNDIFEKIVNPDTGIKFVNGQQKDVVEFLDTLFKSISNGLQHNTNVMI